MDYSLLEYIEFKAEVNDRFKRKEIQNVISLDMRTKDHTLYNWTAWVEDKDTFRPFNGTSYEDLQQFFDDLADNTRTSWREEPMKSFTLSQKDSHNVEVHVYTHRLFHDFQLLRNLFEVSFAKSENNVFARTERRPFKAKARNRKINIIFHETSVLVPLDIKNWAHLLGIKYPETFESEINESFAASLVTAFGIRQFRSKYKTLSNIPMTQSACVRRKVKSSVIGNKYWTEKCHEAVQSYTYDMYKKLSRAFIGGSIGYNPAFKDLVLQNVMSFDESSAYPYVLASKQFPIGKWEKVTDNSDSNFFYLYEVMITNIRSKYENLFFPDEKIDDGDYTQLNNKLYSGSWIKLTITDIDLETFKSMYEYENIEFISIYRSEKGYLPDEIRCLVIESYIEKTTFKHKDKIKYNEAKTSTNCFYGVFVTHDITDSVFFREVDKKITWQKIKLTEDDFNKKIQEMLSVKQWHTYQIGVWVTAYARSILFKMIAHMDSRVIYHDTDCIKGFFTDEDIAFINEYNNSIGTSKEFPMGQFIQEETANEFKFINVKRYAAKYDDHIETVIAGLPKEAGTTHIKTPADLRPGITWNKNESMRTATTYYDKKGDYGVSITGSKFELTEEVSFLDVLGGISPLYKNKTRVFSYL